MTGLPRHDLYGRLERSPRRPLFSLGDAHANAFGGPAEGTIELVDFLIGNEFECVVAENMRNHRFNLYACEIHADTDVWTTAETDQRVWTLLVFFSGSGKSIRIESVRISKDAGHHVRANNRVEHLRSGWHMIPVELEILYDTTRTIGEGRIESFS